MIHASVKSALLLFVSVAILSGCEDPAVNVLTLGRKLAAPVLTSSSPFDQDLETQGYVRITGTCDPRVGSISISFDDATWKYAPSSTTTATTAGNTSTTVTNDNDCADGKFDIYLTKSDILNTWGIDTDSDSTDVTNIYIKGEAWFGDTRTLTLTDPKKNDPTQSGQAAKVVLRKVFPAGFGGAGTCEMFNAVVVDANGNETSSRTALTFGLSNTTGADIPAYSSASDCLSTYNPKTAFGIAANSSNIFIYIKMPTTPLDTAIGFNVTNLSSLSAPSTATAVILRDPASSRRFIAATDMPSTMYKNVCYPVTLQRMDYNKTSPYTYTSVNLTLSPSDSKLQFFAASDCSSSSATTVATIGPSVYSVTIYAKYAMSGASTTTFTKINLNYTASDSNFDTPAIPFRVDLSDKTAVAKIDFWGPNTLSRNICHPYTVVTANSNWTSVPADKDYFVSFASSQTAAGLEFYSDSGCSTSASTLTITQGAIGSKVYVKATAGQNATSQISMSSTGLNTVTRDVTVGVVATNYYFDMAQSYTITKDTCTYLMLNLSDSTGTAIPALSPINLLFTVNSAGSVAGDVTLYTDSSCTTGYAENVPAAISPYSTNNYKFYVKVAASYTGTSLTLLFTGTGLLTLPLMYGTFAVGP
ncbi:hypothetical protein B9G69_005855 [Bdellovibrio sp. SKB1291214]|uniref:hypothetical protein n=1 Tax=Bdellovibrio sp. SKB1291214 TaxID=1732569 RepID=UPI000B5198E1|nr:hypothetical protein [Bdellovibrio sp. SKB1291214]UYL10101.1 hypothetical protein B9G69_005855 [Bdellovibrio sp. SKB1291214]